MAIEHNVSELFSIFLNSNNLSYVCTSFNQKHDIVNLNKINQFQVIRIYLQELEHERQIDKPNA